MSLFPQFPFTNFHELNLDWILKKIKGYDDKIDATNARQDEIEQELQNVETTIADIAEQIVEEAIDAGAFDDEIAEAVAPIQHQVDTQLEAFAGRLNDQDDDIADIAEDVATFENATLRTPQETNLLIIGDSYSENIGGDNITNWTARLTARNIFKNVYVESQGGSGFTGKYSPGTTSGIPAQSSNPALKFANVIKTWVENHTAAERLSINVVLVAGGFNDVYSEANNIRDGIQQFMTYAKPQFPNAVFYRAELGWCGVGNGNLSTPAARSGVLSLPSSSPIQRALTSVIRRRIAQVVIPAYSGAGIYGLNYIGTAIGCLHNYYLDFNEDGYHPSNQGHTNIAKWIANKLTGKNAFVQSYSSIDLLYNPAFTSSLQEADRPVGTVTIASGICTEQGIYINHSLEWYFTYRPAADTGSQTASFNNFMNLVGLRSNILPSADLSFICFIRGQFQGDTGNRSHLGIIRFYQGTDGADWSGGTTAQLDGRLGIAIFPMEGQTMVAGNDYNVRFISQFVPYEMS